MEYMSEELEIKRFAELADRAYKQGTYTFTGFLDMAQTALLYRSEKKLGQIPFVLYGGTKDCERQMARFGSKELFGYDMPFPITCIHVMPLIKKFADDFTHRDFLGAIMNLGIERDTIGDIVMLERECCFFCNENMAPYIIQQLQKVKHTHVKCEVWKEIPITGWKTLEQGAEIVSSERMDGIIAKIYKISRKESLELFQEKKIFVNGRLCENNAYILKKSEIVSVRGFGKFIYDGVIYQTKKDKFRVAYQKYV